MKKKFLILLFIPVLIFSFLIQFGKRSECSIAEKLESLSPEDRKYLDLFFRDSFVFDGLGYTLFGDKPMTAAGYCKSTRKCWDIDDFLDSTFYSFCAENLRRRRGWEILQRHRDLFPVKDYGIVQCKNFADDDFTTVLFINKKAVLATVEKHLVDFKQVLGEEITPEILLSRILKSDDVFGDVLKNHQGLIGILLGYGRHNAWLFQRREEIDPVVLKHRFSLKKPRVQIYQNEIDDLNQRLQGFDDRGILDFNPLLLSLPGFAADPDSEETKQLKINYERQYREIIRRYRKGDFLQITLEQMTSRSAITRPNNGKTRPPTEL